MVAISDAQLEEIRDRARRLLKRVPSFREPYRFLLWQEWYRVPEGYLAKGPEATSLFIAKEAATVMTAVAPVIGYLGGNPRRGWTVGDPTQMWPEHLDGKNEPTGTLFGYVEWRQEATPAWRYDDASEYAIYGPDVSVYSRLPWST